MCTKALPNFMVLFAEYSKEYHTVFKKKEKKRKKNIAICHHICNMEIILEDVTSGLCTLLPEIQAQQAASCSPNGYDTSLNNDDTELEIKMTLVDSLL